MRTHSSHSPSTFREFLAVSLLFSLYIWSTPGLCLQLLPLLYLLTFPAHVIHFYTFKYHLFADYSQISVSSLNLLLQIQNCRCNYTRNIYHYVCLNSQKSHLARTKLLIPPFFTNHLLSQSCKQHHHLPVSQRFVIVFSSSLSVTPTSDSLASPVDCVQNTSRLSISTGTSPDQASTISYLGSCVNLLMVSLPPSCLPTQQPDWSS